ncbi:SpaA isopeptide-forming pilin-related protein [Levyella massiliensis]|uniref:SpaA isopeptide-forming pilin-related protein n=1 Tax=Levyella massiliensis TaxID=938289 RepID=UPI00035CCD76|nr:SpaA isopeptide-forming pilin-related protein [Levyella massiliensis]
MKKTERVLSLLLAIILLLTGVPVGGFGMVSEARRQDAYSDAQSRLFVAESAKALPSLTKRLLPAEPPKEGTEDPALSGSESQTIVTGSDITSTSSVSGEQNGEALPSSAKTEQAAETTGQESPAQNQEEKDAQTLEAVRREMEKNPLTGGKALPIQDVDLNGTKSLARVNYIVNRDTDGIPASISWVLTYFAPKEKTAHQAFVVANGDNLDQPVIGNRTYAPGEEAAMKAREAARARQTDKAPLFLYDIETKEANKDGFFLTTITTPIHRDEAMVAKINAAKAAKSIDKKALKDVAKELEGRVYTLDMISVFGEQKITKRIQVNGKADLTATDENTTPVTHVFPQKQQQENPQQEQEKRVLFVAPNQDKKETAYQAPTSNATDAKQKEQAQIMVYDFVLSQDGFYDFKAVDQRSLAQYEKQLTEIEEKGLTGEALQNARKAATLSIQPGQFAITMASETVKAEEKTTASEAPQPPTETKPSENAAPSTTEEEAEEKNTASAANATDENAERAPSRIDEKTANEAAEAAAKTAELLPLGKTLEENASLRKTLEEGTITNLLQPMGAPLNPYTTKRPIIIEVVDRDNKGVKIPGAVVRITGPGMVREVTTGEDGQAVVENCNVGNYEVVQVSAPKGYFPNQYKITFRFSAIETSKYVRIDNAKDFGTQLYYIEGTAVDNDNRTIKIAGVELELLAYENNHGTKGNSVPSMNRTAYTDEQGHFVFNDLLPKYIYEVVVVKAPYEYAFTSGSGATYSDIRFQDDNGQPLKVNGGVKYKEKLDVYLSKNTNQAVTITVYNHEKGDQQVSIIGSAFQILDERGEVIKDIGTLRTDGQGKITFHVRPGNYTIEQLTTDAYHLMPNARTPIVVQPLPHDTNQDIYLIPNPLKDIGSVTYNMDAVINWGNVTPVPDAKVILKENGVESARTPEKIGQIYRFKDLPKYDANHEQIDYRIELKDHPEYYATYRIVNGVVNIDVHEISTPEGPGGTVTVTGNKIWYNDSQDLLKRPAIIHVILLANGRETQYRATVSEATDWKYSFTNLPRFDQSGKEITYTVKEVQMSAGGALPGYRMDQTILGKNVLNTKIDNSKIGGEFNLEKTDAAGNPLEGAQFTLSGTMDNGQELNPERSLKTDANGKLIFKDIPAGTYTLKETQAPDRYEPSTETWKVEVSSDGKTILVGSGVTNPANAGFPKTLQTGQEFVKDGEGAKARTITNEKARNPVPFQKTIYTRNGLTDAEKAKDENQVGDISKRILNTVDKNQNEYQVELTVQGRGRSSFAGGESTDIVLVVDHSGSIKTSRNEDQVRNQVRNIVSAFSNFSNVNMGYVEYAGITVDKNKNASARNDNFSDYRWWNPYEKNGKYDNDPAVTSSVELTSPGKLAADSKFNTNRFGGGTFTQRALLRAEEILAKGHGTNKHIILITDGGPTLSFKAKGSKDNGKRPDGSDWGRIYKPNSKIPDNYNDVSDSGLKYNGRASGFETNTLRGDGTYYQFGTSKGDTNQLAYASYTAGSDEVLDNVYATVSTVRDLTDKKIKVTTIGYNLQTLNNAGWFNGQEKFFFPQMASSPQNYSGLGKTGNTDNAVTSIYDEVSKQFYLNSQKTTTPSIEKAVVTDPMGDGVDLYLGEDGVFNEKDYVLVASDGSIYKNGKAPTEGLLKDVKLTYDEKDRKFKMEGLTLGKDESVSLYYSVRLKDSYRNGNFTPTNNTTTLVNNGRTEDFPIPAIRDRVAVPTVKVGNQAYSKSGRIRILKVNEKKEALSGAYFTLTNDVTHEKIMIQPSGKDGKIEVNNIPKGDYTLKEVEAPAGYVVSGLSWHIHVDDNGKTTITQNPTGSRSAFSTRSATPEAMGNLLEMGPMMGLAAVGAGAPAGNNYKISATTTFNDADPDNKKFAIHHEAVGQTLKKELDLYFLLVPETAGNLTLFNNRIRDYSNELAKEGYQGYINVIYGGYDEASTQYTYWRIGNVPALLTQVPIGRSETGAWMDRALYTANDILYRHLHEDTVKVVTFLSTGRNFAGEEAYYNHNLKRMIKSGVISRYINLVTNTSGVNTLENTLKDSSSPIPKNLRQEMKDKLRSGVLSEEAASTFKGRIADVYSKFTVENTVNNESLVIPLAANIHNLGSQRAKIVDSWGNTIQTVKMTATTDSLGMTTLRTGPVTLGSGERLVVDYDVTLKGDYKRAISYPVYATGAVQWEGNGTTKGAGIQSAYVNDPGQNLNIEVKGLEGYPGTVGLTVTTNREGTETFSLKNGDVKAKTILTFDVNGNTQGPNNIKFTADPAPNSNYQGPTIDKSKYPVVRVVYERKALNLTVRKVFNNRQPGARDLDVILVAKVNGQEKSLASLGYTGSEKRTLVQKKDAQGKPVEGVYEIVYSSLPLKDQNGNEIDYSVKDSSSSQDQGNNITLIREETVTSYRPEDDLIRIEETELPVLTVINATNEIKFKKVGESGQQRDQFGNLIEGPNGPLMIETPLAEAEFELRRETPSGSIVVKGYEKIVSGPNGEFGFKNLPPGDYGIYETKPVLGYELPVQAVSTFTIDADGKPKDIKSFKERTKKDGDWILGIQKTMKNNVSVETAITQVEATDHNQGNRKMLYTQRIYVNRNGERLTEANFGLFSAAADNPIVNASYKIWKVTQGGRKPAPMDFNKALDTTNYDLSLVKEVKAPANLSAIKLDGLPSTDSLPSTDFYVIEVKGELEVHDDKFTSKLTFFTSATEEHPGETHQITDFKPSDNGTIITGFRKGKQGDDADIMSSATIDPGTGSYVVRNYRGSTFFSVQKTKEGDGKPLAGAKFKLWAALGRNFEIVETEHTTQVTTGAELVTDENGIITFDNLPVNYNFYLEETETAPGFALPNYMWIVQIRPTSFLKELHAKSRDWKDYLSSGVSEAEAKKQAAAVAYSQMLYPYTLPDPNATNRPAEDITADQEGFKVFVYQTDGRKPLIIRPKDANGEDLHGNPVDPATYVKDKYGDVIAEQSYGNHPTIPGMWYRKGWVAFTDPKPKDEKGKEMQGQMMPINEYGQPIHENWKKDGWKGESIDGVSGATIRPLIVKDWIQKARDFDGRAQDDRFLTSTDYSTFAQQFKTDNMVPATDLTIPGKTPGTKTTIPSVVGITNSQTEFFINKVDQDGKPLEGAEFELVKVENGVEIQPGIKPTRKAKNQFIFDKLKDGIYHLKETKIPEGYQEPTTYWEITVEDGAVTNKVEKPIDPQGSNGTNAAQALSQPVSNAPQAMMAGEGRSLLAPVALRLAASSLPVEETTLPKLTLFEAVQTAEARTSSNPMMTPMRGGQEHYADENLNLGSTKNQQIKKSSQDVDLGIKFTQISNINVNSGTGTFEARIYIDAKDLYLDVSNKNSRILELEPKSNVTLTEINQYSLNKTKFPSVDFYTNVSKIKGNMLGTGSQRMIPINATNRYALDVNPNHTRYLLIVKGTYQNESNDPLQLFAKYHGKLKKAETDNNSWESRQAEATSQVYHYDQYLVTYGGNGGTPASSDETVRRGKPVTSTPTLTRDKYRFLGWQESGQDVDLMNDPAFKSVTADHALVAKWERVYKVYFVDQNRKVIETREVPQGQTYLQAHPEGLPKPKRPGYELTDWRYYNWDIFDGKDVITDDTVVYPNWEAKANTVVLYFYMLNDNSAIERDKTQTREVEYGKGLAQAQIPPSDPASKLGYTFSGWQVYDYYQRRYVDVDLVNQHFYGNRAFYGRWIPTTYTVTFQDEHGTILKTAQVPHGDHITAPSIAARDGYTFDGWKDAAGNAFDPTTAITAPATYTAKWTKIQPDEVSVIFNSSGGSAVADQIVIKGGKIKKPADPTKEGYTFDGWRDASGNAFNFNTAIYDSITLTASWTQNPDQGTLNELTVKNTKKDFEGEFSIDKFEKKDGGNRAKLRDAYFSLTRHKGAELPESFDQAVYATRYSNPYWVMPDGPFKTDANGKIAFNHLQPGVYDLVEKQSPSGYLANTEKYVVVVNEIGNTIIVPEAGYDPDKYPIKVDHGTVPTPDPNQPTKRTTPQSLDGVLKVEKYALKTSDEDGIIRPLQDQRFSMEYTIHLPEDAIPGDTFTITLDEHLNWGGIRIDAEKVQDIVTEHGQVVAETKDKTLDEDGNVVRKITYTLTDYVANRTDITIHQTVPVYVDHDKVANSTGLAFTNIIGNTPKTSDSIWVDFRNYYGTGGRVDSGYDWPLRGKRQELWNNLGGWFYEDRTNSQIELYYYVFGYNNSWSTQYYLDMAARSWLQNTTSDVNYNDVKISVYKTDAYTATGNPNTATMPPSYGRHIMDLRDENLVMKEKSFVADQNGFIRVPLDVDTDYPNGGRFGYIVKVVAPFDNTKDQVDLYTYAKLSHETEFYYRDFWNREHYVTNTDGPVTYWNYLHRYTGSSGASAQDLVNLTLTKRELLGKDGEDKYNTKLIPGAGFKLTNNQGFQDYAVTGADGKVLFTKLKPGDYFLEEVLTPKGYTPINVVWDIHIDKDGTITVSDPGGTGLIESKEKNDLAVWNRKTPIDKPVLQFPNIPNRIEFTKVGESGTPLQGATLELRKSDTVDGTYVVVTSPNGPRTSGKDGKFFWTNLAPGYYQVWETGAPAGYITPPKEVATFLVDTATGEIKNLQISGRDPVGENMIRNLRPMKMALRKVDDKKLDITKGSVTFAVSAAPGNNNPVLKDLQTITVDLTKAGPYVREIPGSMNGKYILSEMTPPSGYVKTTQQYEIEIDQDKRTISLTKVTDGKNEVPYLDKGLLSKAGPVILYQEGASDQISLDIVNHLYYTLPTTAGPGTFLFTLAGAFLLGLAFSLFRQTKGPSGRPRKRLPFLRRQLE